MILNWRKISALLAAAVALTPVWLMLTTQPARGAVGGIVGGTPSASGTGNVSIVSTTNLVVYNVLVVSNVYVTNLFSGKISVTNLYSTNIYVSNIYGQTIITTNLYVSNIVAQTIVVSGGSTFDNITVTNGVNHVRSSVNSSSTTNQIDAARGPQYYYWTNMVTNVVLQVTNVFPLGITNRTLDFFFTGGSSDYTVTFSCPNPGGVVFHWGQWSATNGATSFTVTNGHAAGAALTFWESNLVEGYFSPVR